MTYTWLSHPSIDAGSKIDIMGKVATFDFRNFIKDNYVPSKDVGSPYTERLSQVSYTGHANPKYVIEGFFQSGLATNNVGSIAITFPHLGSFGMVGSFVYMGDDSLMLNPAGSTTVFVSNFTVNHDAKSEKNFNYKMELVETQEW